MPEPPGSGGDENSTPTTITTLDPRPLAYLSVMRNLAGRLISLVEQCLHHKTPSRELSAPWASPWWPEQRRWRQPVLTNYS